MAKLAVLILTYNEELHIERCIKSVLSFTEEIFIVDSYSTDNTVMLAERFSDSVTVVQHKFVTQSDQVNWALDSLNFRSDWIMRLDADEYVTSALASDVIDKIVQNDSIGHLGFKVSRMMRFMERNIRYGGMYPVWHLRVWRKGYGISNGSIMDEHMVLTEEGSIGSLNGDIIDDNLKGISWWIEKHNTYASREAIMSEIPEINMSTYDQLKFLESETSQREHKKNIYKKLPLFIRPLLLLLYKLLFKGALRDGIAGFIWVILQTFWYRFLVDVKIFILRKKDVSIEDFGDMDFERFFR